MIKGFLLGIAMVAVVMAGYLAHHLGIFRGVDIGEEERGPFYVLFQNHTGAYYKIADTIGTVESAAHDMSLDCRRTFGEYFDNPKEVDEDRLTSRGGCLSDAPFAKVPANCKTDSIPKRKYIVARFTGSPAIGPWKVYPAVDAYIQSHQLANAGAAIEIYILNGDSIETEYLFPVK